MLILRTQSSASTTLTSVSLDFFKHFFKHCAETWIIGKIGKYQIKILTKSSLKSVNNKTKVYFQFHASKNYMCFGYTILNNEYFNIKYVIIIVLICTAVSLLFWNDIDVISENCIYKWFIYATTIAVLG